MGILVLCELSFVPFPPLGWFFPQSRTVPSHKGTEQHSAEDSTGTLCRSLKLFVQLSSLHPTILWPWPAWGSLYSKLSLFNSWRPHILPTIPFPVHLLRNSFQEVTWGNHNIHLIHFPSVIYHYPLLPYVPCQKTIVSHICPFSLLLQVG